MRFRTDRSSPEYKIHLLKKLRIFRRAASLLFNVISYKLNNSFPLLIVKPKTTSGRSIMRANASEYKPMLYSKRLGVTWLQLIVRITLERLMKNPSPPQAQ
jgi:hypothetical protein